MHSTRVPSLFLCWKIIVSASLVASAQSKVNSTLEICVAKQQQQQQQSYASQKRHHVHCILLKTDVFIWELDVGELFAQILS